jgi:hypothetical protein
MPAQGAPCAEHAKGETLHVRIGPHLIAPRVIMYVLPRGLRGLRTETHQQLPGVMRENKAWIIAHDRLPPPQRRECKRWERNSAADAAIRALWSRARAG